MSEWDQATLDQPNNHLLASRTRPERRTSSTMPASSALATLLSKFQEGLELELELKDLYSANVTPSHKKGGGEGDLGIYRPVSLTSIP